MKTAVAYILCLFVIANIEVCEPKGFSFGRSGGKSSFSSSRASSSSKSWTSSKSSSKTSSSGWSRASSGKTYTSFNSYNKPAYRPMPSYAGRSTTVVSRPVVYTQPMYIPMGYGYGYGYPYYYGGYYRSRSSSGSKETKNGADAKPVQFVNGPEVNKGLSCSFIKELCSYMKNTSAVNSNYLDFALGSLKIDSDLGSIFSPYVISRYPLCMTFSYRLVADSSDDKNVIFEIKEDNELSLATKTLYQDGEVVSDWRTSNVTLETVSLSLDPTKDKLKSFRIRFSISASNAKNYVNIKDAMVKDGACNAVYDKSLPVNIGDYADYRDDFVCYNSTGFVGRHMLCDGVQDCQAAEDEWPTMCETTCPSNGIYCKPVNSSAPAYCLNNADKYCNGVIDCDNGVDEDNNMCDSVKYCYHPMADYCRNSGNCVAATNQKGAGCQCMSSYVGKRCQNMSPLVQPIQPSRFNWALAATWACLLVVVVLCITMLFRKIVQKKPFIRQ
ncbi:hypothetical protein HDE_14338 [Halotydeus destructor]|nr:hypothetical protein HDE_14338 [Halotydeus destructor]